MVREVLTHQARSEFKYVAPKPWCKTMSQAVAVTIVNHKGESKEQYKVKIGLCNVETTYLRATFLLPTLAPQDRFANYDIEADPLLSQLYVTHRPRLFLDSWGLHPKVYGLPRPPRQQPSISAAVAKTLDTGLATDTGGNTVGLQANEREEHIEQDDNAACAREEPVMNESAAESSAKSDLAVVISGVEAPVVDQAVKDEPVAREPVIDDILAVKNNDRIISQEDSRPNNAITIDAKLSQSYDYLSLSSPPEDKRSVSPSPTAKSPAVPTPEKKCQASGSCTPPTSAGSTPEKGETGKQISKEVRKSLELPSSVQSQAFENQEHLAEVINLDNDRFSLSSVVVEPALIDQAALDAVTTKAEEVSHSSRYSMFGSALSFAQEEFSLTLDSNPTNAVPIKQDAKTCSAKIVTPETKMEPFKPQNLASSLMDQSNSGPTTRAATGGIGSKKGNKKKQKKGAKKAKKASKVEDFGSNGPSQHEDQPEPSATAPAADVSCGFPEEEKALPNKRQGSATSSFTTASPTPSEEGSDSGASPLAISSVERSMSDKSRTPSEDSKQNLPAPPPTEGKIAKKGKAKKKNANRKAKRAIMFAAMNDKESGRQTERARLVEASIDGVSSCDVSAVDATLELDDQKTEVDEEISTETMAEDMKQESDISKSPIAENIQSDFWQSGETHTLTTSGEDPGREIFEDPHVIDTSTVKLKNQNLKVAPDMQNPLDATTSEERNHEDDKTTCDGSTIQITSELGRSKALIVDKEHCIVTTIAKSPSVVTSKAITHVQPCTAITKNFSTSQVIQAQRLFIPRCLLVSRMSSRSIWKTRALVMHGKGATGEGHGKSKRIDTLNIQKAKIDCKNVPRITQTQDLSGSDVPTIQDRLTTNNSYLDVSVGPITYNSDRLLTDKPWTVREAGRNFEIVTESSTGQGSTEASEKDTLALHINIAVPLNAPRETYNPKSFLSPGVASLIIKKMNATALRNPVGLQLKGEGPEKSTSGPLAGDYQSACSGTLQQDVEESRSKGKMVEQSLLEDIDEPFLNKTIGKTPLREDAKQHLHPSRDNVVSLVPPQGIHNPQCLLPHGETSWIIEKINATTSGDFDESELKKRTLEPVAEEENTNKNGPSFLDAPPTSEMVDDESEPKAKTVEPTSNAASDPDHSSPLDTIATSPTTTTTSPSPPAHQTIAVNSIEKPAITSALETINIVQAATAVQEQPEDKYLLLQFILVLVLRFVGLLFE